MQMTPMIAVHLTAALTALLVGPVALWARRGHTAGPTTHQRTRLHRAAGYAWVTLMLLTALSSLFIHDPALTGLFGFSPIHLFVPVTLLGLVQAFRQLFRGNVAGHRKTMLGLYLGACVGAGVFTLLPQRTLGQLVWGQLLGLL